MPGCSLLRTCPDLLRTNLHVVHPGPPIACLAGMEPMSPFVPDFVILPTPTLPTLVDETRPKTLAGGM
jgi:hypothetical protein